MLKPIAAALMLTALTFQTAAHAAPDDMDKLLAQKGLVSRLGDSIQHATDRAADLVLTAMGAIGVPYRLGGASAETGFDCSGFVRAIFQQSEGLLLPRTAAEQAAATQQIAKADLKPGDLVFFNTLRRPNSHVGIYVGDGKFIHSPRTGAHVRVESMNVRYWQSRFNGARRVLLGEAPATAAASAAQSPQSPSPAATALTAALSKAERNAPSATVTAAAAATATATAQATLNGAPRLLNRPSPAPRSVRLGNAGGSKSVQGKKAKSKPAAAQLRQASAKPGKPGAKRPSAATRRA